MPAMPRRTFLGAATGTLAATLLAACGSGGAGNATDDTQTDAGTTTDASGSPQPTGQVTEATGAAQQGVPLVVFFSRTGEQYGVGTIETGNTAIVAGMIADVTGAESWEVVPDEDYPTTYDELTDVARDEQNENARPTYQGSLPDLDGHGTVFIGSPVWWGDWPMVMYTLFEENAAAFAGHTLVPFSTHAGSGLADFADALSSSCPDATLADGLAVLGTDAQNNQDSVRSTVEDWLSGLG